MTLVGTPPNILVGALLAEYDLEPFELFDFTPLGAVLLVGGILFMVTLGRRFLPVRDMGLKLSESRDLAEVYQVQERLFSIRIPENSGLDGLTLSQAHLGRTLGVQVLAITRQGERQLAPEPDAVLRSGDVLLVEGRLPDLRELLRVQGVQVHKAGTGKLPPAVAGAGGVRAILASGSPLIGQTLRKLRFRERYGVVVIAIRRGEEIVDSRLGDEELLEGDEIVAVGKSSQLDHLAMQPDLVKADLDFPTLRELRAHLYLMGIPEGSPLIGSTVAQSRIGELVGITVAGIVRGGKTELAVSPEESIQVGDKLLVAGEPSRVIKLLEVGEVHLDTEVSEPELESGDVGVVEATIAPRSEVAGRTLQELAFRERYGLQVLAIWRETTPVRTKLARLPLRFGDALLLQGPYRKLQQLAADRDFLVLSELAQAPRRMEKMPYAVAGLLLMVALVVSGWQPIQVAAFSAATLVILSGAITMQEAYRAIEWRAIFLVAAVLPVGFAMESTGAATLFARSLVEVAGPLGPYALLAGIVILSSLLSQGLDGAPAVVLLAPVVIESARQLGISPYPIMMGAGLAASAAFMTPFSHKANLLVMGAGGYRSVDYLKVGTPLTIILLLFLVLLVPVFFPF
jgi:di/tricarboxylate transporter